MQPINYQLDVQSPFESLNKGYQQGLTNQAGLLQMAAETQKIKLAQQKQEMQKQMQMDFAQLASNPNASAKDYAAVMTKYPEFSEQLKRPFDLLDAEQKKNILSQATQADAALQQGRYDIALNLVQRQAEAYKNSNRPQEAKLAGDLAQQIKENPEGAKTSMTTWLANVLGPDKYVENLNNLRKGPSDVAKSEADAQKARFDAENAPEKAAWEQNLTKAQIRNFNSQITNRAEQLNLDRDKLQSELQTKLYELKQKQNPALNLGDDARKIINESAINSTTSEHSANQLLDLSNRLLKEAPTAGWAGGWGEGLKRMTGSEDAISQLRKDYLRIRNSQVLKVLPPGPANDRDIEFAMAPFPTENANPDVLASTLRGMAKLEQYNAVYENAKSEWMNNVGHLGKAKSDIDIDGVKVPSGSTFNNFAREFLAQKQQELSQRQAQQNLPNRSYMEFAKPQGQ